jgi:2-phospho-L-lactate/phosphoenolpyruvate guanylyltransferase
VDAHVLVPVKRLDGAKSRLESVLSPAERGDLMRSLLDGVVTAIRQAGVERITLVTSEPLELEGVERWDDRGLPWNEALLTAMREVVTAPVATIVSADLPLLTAEDVIALIDATPEHGIAIARATDAGTNAVSMRPPAALTTVFGEPASARRHADAAELAGLDWVVLDRPGLAFDLDTPEDLEQLRGEAA